VSPQKSSKPGGPFRRPQADVYTVLLLLALLALILGIVCLYFEMDMYNFEIKGGPTVSAGHTAHYPLSEKGDRYILPERPEGCFVQNVPVPFFVTHNPLTPGTDAPSPA